MSHARFKPAQGLTSARSTKDGRARHSQERRDPKPRIGKGERDRSDMLRRKRNWPRTCAGRWSEFVDTVCRVRQIDPSGENQHSSRSHKPASVGATPTSAIMPCFDREAERKRDERLCDSDHKRTAGSCGKCWETGSRARFQLWHPFQPNRKSAQFLQHHREKVNFRDLE